MLIVTVQNQEEEEEGKEEKHNMENVRVSIVLILCDCTKMRISYIRYSAGDKYFMT